jgi:hypothetical protein
LIIIIISDGTHIMERSMVLNRWQGLQQPLLGSQDGARASA